MIKKTIDFDKGICKKIPLNTAILKLIEELAEAQTELVKYLTKEEKIKPSLDTLSKELGDVLFRTEVVARKLKIESKIEERCKFKTREVFHYLDVNKSFTVTIKH